MRLGRRSTNISDRRGMGGVVAGGGVGVLVLALIGLFFGVDPTALIQGGGGGGAATGEPGRAGVPTDPAGDTVAAVLGSTEDAWTAIFRQNGEEYPPPTLVLFENAVQSACGFAQSAVGPFYCPRDQQVYIDLAFFRDLSQRFGATGDFARAYVIAHEVGHHVQNVTGVFDRAGGARDNETSVRQELQADCLAGLWAYHAGMQNLLEPGDIEEALSAAAAIGDDRLQQQSQGRVVPESFTHGSSAQRVRWFRRGYETGSLDNCDTFGTSTL
ncbi:MAG TPA: neutral zinc metallopeptidase [Longimicrobiales bacterium]|nr:neutral zinc metallopeptidase [Longimicrobiales bacterium]